jgi:hypothetical protein
LAATQLAKTRPWRPSGQLWAVLGLLEKLMTDREQELSRIACRVAAAKMRVENFLMMNVPTKFEDRAAMEKASMEAQREYAQALIERDKWIKHAE